MNKELYYSDLYIADYTTYNNDHSGCTGQIPGVAVSHCKPEMISAFYLKNRNGCEIEVINFEQNPSLLKRADGSKASQCECILNSKRESGKPWMIFLELKYCSSKNVSANVTGALSQVKSTYDFLLKHRKAEIDVTTYKPYFIISTPGVEPIDPFDAFYFSQDESLTLKERYGAVLFYSNEVEVLTPAHIRKQKKEVVMIGPAFG